MAVLCIDAGTTVVKAVVFGADGEALALSRRETPVHRGAGGISEQDMDTVWEAVVGAVGGALAQTREPVELLAFTGQGDGCWLVDAAGAPTGRAILWNDARAVEIMERWDAAGVLTEAYRINGTLGFTGTSGAIMRWLFEHDPDRLAASHQALSCDGWLFLRLTGEFAADESDAAAPFMDLRSRRYAAALFDLFGMAWVARLLPEIRDDAHRVGELLPAVAAQLSLPAGLPVVMAPFDIPATSIGTGAIAPGTGCVILGTTLSTQTVLTQPDTAGTPAGMQVPSGVAATYVRSLAAMAGVEVIGWAMGLLGLDQPNWLSELAATAVPGAEGLVFHPYLSPAGERAPFRDPAARGDLLGLSLRHGRPELARAVLEGMSFVVRDCLEVAAAGVTELRLCGGGANSEFWCQLLADVTGVPTVRTADAEIGAKGAMLVGLVASGKEAELADAAGRYVRRRDSFAPDPATAAVYTELFEDFRRSREMVAAEWPRLAEARARNRAVA